MMPQGFSVCNSVLFSLHQWFSKCGCINLHHQGIFLLVVAFPKECSGPVVKDCYTESETLMVRPATCCNKSSEDYDTHQCL